MFPYACWWFYQKFLTKNTFMYECIYVCIFQESHSCIQMDSYTLVYAETIRSVFIKINSVLQMLNIQVG